ncbi:hypothetical protein C8D92_110110 [Tamilnaduibacter salinus]|uniref:DUF4252 domain-containing protein n=1 Tax=Tamilnaduibacter salinus TaxID=1484056 RepID=A0A2U1CTK8_9GAMM|nr:hypothetical protein [Tamilnaduibacter salinus]PVY70079.1 hypothetical protein C8D92_110110 [Tamilnaduibacter salinus]
MRFTLLVVLVALTLVGCSSRQLTDNLNGSTAQRLVTHSIDDLMGELEHERLERLKGQRVYLETNFPYPSRQKASGDQSLVKDYADKRLALALQRQFGAQMVDSKAQADQVMNVFYNSLATDQSDFGFSVPLGFIPGIGQNAKINLITLEKYHGISEMYYFIGATGVENRSDTLQAVVRTDALGLPFITIPFSNLDREE